jgi:hypothetical protein
MLDFWLIELEELRVVIVRLLVYPRDILEDLYIPIHLKGGGDPPSDDIRNQKQQKKRNEREKKESSVLKWKKKKEEGRRDRGFF